MFFQILCRVHTYIPLYQLFFSFPSFINFAVCKLCRFFPFYVHFFLKFTLLKRNFPISSNFLCSHSAKKHREKSLLCTEFLLFFHSGFICYDRPWNVSFSTQAAPIIATTGQGEPAPTLVHSPSWVRPLRGCLSVHLETLILSKMIFTPKTANNCFMLK
jgi:hypothetical protein